MLNRIIMKRVFVYLILFIGFSQVSQAQYLEVYYGVKAGTNISQLYYTGDQNNFLDNDRMKVSAHFGAFAEIVFNEFFSLQPEFLYSIKGARFKDVSDDNLRYHYEYHYLSLPIMAKYYVTKRINIQAGPQVAYLVNAKNLSIDDINRTNNGYEEAPINLYEETQPFDAGVVLGLGYLTDTGFYLSARYNLGLLNTWKKQDGLNRSLTNGTAQISAGFSFF